MLRLNHHYSQAFLNSPSPEGLVTNGAGGLRAVVLVAQVLTGSGSVLASHVGVRSVVLVADAIRTAGVAASLGADLAFVELTSVA